MTAPRHQPSATGQSPVTPPTPSEHDDAPGDVRVLSGLLVPADPDLPLSLCAVEDSTVAISDLLGGVLLDALTWDVDAEALVTVYSAEDRASLPVNQRLSVVATRLGIVDRAFHAAARGDALVLGTTHHQVVDTDVPAAVTLAAHRCGYQIAPVASPSISARQ